MSNPSDDIKAVVELNHEQDWKDNPILVANEDLAERARTICKENNIPVKIEVVKAKWERK